MIKWKRIEAGEYESEDGQFLITNTWNRVYGNHWDLRDKREPDRYKGTYHEKTLLECKLRAEEIASSEN